jgi:hypothetical protein
MDVKLIQGPSCHRVDCQSHLTHSEDPLPMALLIQLVDGIVERRSSRGPAVARVGRRWPSRKKVYLRIIYSGDYFRDNSQKTKRLTEARVFQDTKTLPNLRGRIRRTKDVNAERNRRVGRIRSRPEGVAGHRSLYARADRCPKRSGDGGRTPGSSSEVEPFS